jgi:bifunctional non-homologous end joining protein LigD
MVPTRVSVAPSFPEWVEPMAATLTQERFTGPEWIFERKFDGIRLLSFKHGQDVRLLSRNRLPQHIPSIVEAIMKLPIDDAILDGEVTWRGTVAYHVFDVVWLNGRDVRSLPLEQRRALLSGLPFRSPLQRVASLDDPKPWERACSEGWEGVIAKRRDSLYEHRRSPHWLKMKCEATQDFVVGGFTDPQGGRVGLGALLVGYYLPRESSEPSERKSAGEEQDFVFAGKVGTGFDTKLLLDLRARLDTLEIAKTPFTKAIALPRLRAHWVRPEIVVQVAFIEWTVHGKLRHSRLLAVHP